MNEKLQKALKEEKLRKIEVENNIKLEKAAKRLAEIAKNIRERQ